MFESLHASRQKRIIAQKKAESQSLRTTRELEEIFDHRAKNVATVKALPRYGKPN